MLQVMVIFEDDKWSVGANTAVFTSLFTSKLAFASINAPMISVNPYLYLPSITIKSHLDTYNTFVAEMM